MKEDNIYNYCHIAGRTDIGCKRQANEDSMGNFETINGLAAVVCDGMGGHVGGATASRIAVEAIHDFLDKQFCEDPREAIGEAIDTANKAILQQAMIQSELKGMGSTCVLLLVRDSKVYIGHVGDSRIYLIRNRRIKQLTKDHSYVQMLVDMGQLTYEQAEHHPRKNEITNALGIANMKSATVQPDAILPEAGDCFLLCSDGLSGMVSDREIERIVSRQSEMNSQERVDYLVQRAKDHGGLDNITVEIVEFSITPSSLSSKPKRKKWSLIALAAILLVGIGAGYYFWNKHLKSTISVQAGNSQPLMRKDTIIRLPEIRFEKAERILEIKYGQGCTEILMGKDKISVAKINRTLVNDSLKCGKDIEIFENRLLFFREGFKYTELHFSLADTITIFRFVLPVSQDIKMPEQTVEPSAEKAEDATKRPKDIASTVSAMGKVETVSYQFYFDYEETSVFILTEGKAAAFGAAGKQPSLLNCNFHVNTIKCNQAYFKVKKEANEAYHVSFIGKDIPKGDNAKIIFEGKEMVERGNPVLRNIVFDIIKKGT